MKRRLKVGIIVAVAVLAVCATIWSVFVLADRAAVPFQYMWVWFEDEGNVATIRCDAFRVAFEGQSFGDRSRSGNYVVDGRYGPRLFGGPESRALQVGDGVAYEYSQRERVLRIRYQGHEVTYSHALKKVTIVGEQYSTADGQVQLVIKGNGKVVRAAN